MVARREKYFFGIPSDPCASETDVETAERATFMPRAENGARGLPGSLSPSVLKNGSTKNSVDMQFQLCQTLIKEIFQVIISDKSFSFFVFKYKCVSIKLFSKYFRCGGFFFGGGGV